MVILVDMDNVLADFDSYMEQQLRQKFPDISIIPAEKRTQFYFKNNFSSMYHKQIESLYLNKGFYLNLPLINDAKEAIEYLSIKNAVYITTSALLQNPYCVSEKYKWVENNLGSGWLSKIIVTTDKTLINGDILIDDKPEIKGSITPKWTHVLYDSYYNRDVLNKTRITWENYKNVLML